MTTRPKSDSGARTAASVESFVHRQNIHRYRRLLEAERDDRKRQTLLTMLAQEESVIEAIDSGAVAPKAAPDFS